MFYHTETEAAAITYDPPPFEMLPTLGDLADSFEEVVGQVGSDIGNHRELQEVLREDLEQPARTTVAALLAALGGHELIREQAYCSRLPATVPPSPGRYSR